MSAPSTPPHRPSAVSLTPAQAQLARSIDHTLLKPDAGPAEIQKLCQEALDYSFATVCIHPEWLPLATSLLTSSRVLPIAVIGFPLGTQTTAVKVFETQEAIRLGACEIDMVMNIGKLKAKDWAFVEADIHAVVQACAGVPLKVILETGLLSDSEKVTACQLAQKAGAAFVKTSTGFGAGGATEADIRLMRQTVGPQMGVKASGGVRTTQDAQKMLAAGANRIGASASVAIVTGANTTATAPGGY